MPILRNMTIKYKLILIIMLTCVTGMVLAGATLIVWRWRISRGDMVQNVSTQAEMIAENCKASLAFQDAKDAEKTLQALHVEPSIVFGGVYTKDNKLFAAYYRDYADIKVHPPKFQKSGFSFNEGFLTVFKPIVLEGEIIGTVCLRSDMNAVYAMLKRHTSVVIVVLLLSSFITFFVSSRLQKVISKPILSLAESAAKIGKGELNHRVKIQSKDELGHLASSFNEMTENLQKTTTSIDNLNREITERKKAEGQLRKTEEKYRAQFEGALDAIFVAAAETGIIVDCNPAAMKLVGREKSELIGQHQRILHPPEIIDGGFSKTYKEHLETKQGQTLETQIITKTGRIKDVAIKASLLEVRGKKLMQGIFRDITENKKAEQRQAQLLEQLERANEELKSFAYIVSHDLKAPLRGIATLADWISTDYADKLDEQGREQINLLISRVGRMHNLINGILQYSRIGRVKEEKVVVNLNELVSEVIDLIAPPENIAITVENELPTIGCERTSITQVFQNLISNAVKYMDKPDGQIRIGCVEEGRWWKFSVSDNGPGIEEKYFEKIFQIFQTLTRRDEFESTGVGLSLVKKIVEMYGGKVWVESKPGEGSTFFFILPKQGTEVKNEELQANIVS